MRKDFEKYLAAMSNQREKFLDVVKEAEELAKEGKLTEEAANNINIQWAVIEANYQRLVYCKHLLMLPPKFIQKIMEKKLIKESERFKKALADAESVKKENEAATEAAKEEVQRESE